MTMLLSTSLMSNAIAHSGGRHPSRASRAPSRPRLSAGISKKATLEAALVLCQRLSRFFCHCLNLNRGKLAHVVLPRAGCHRDLRLRADTVEKLKNSTRAKISLKSARGELRQEKPSRKS